MATNTNLLDYSKQLAIKMRDPVDEGGADGKLFHAEHRYGYLTSICYSFEEARDCIKDYLRG